MSQLIDTWQTLDLRRRVILVGAVVLTLVAVLSLAQMATRPGMALLYSGLDPATAGEVVGALEQMNVQAEVRGDAIYVAEDERDRVRLALARDGLPRQGQAGYELLDELSGFSATADMFNAAYWRAKEGELARTILSSPGVVAARVHIAVPNRRPFARDGAAPTASVTVTMAGGALTMAQATSIRYVTALAVADLSPEQVGVIDSRTGMVLAPGTDNPMTSAASEAAEREHKLKSEIEALLAARVGRDRARVSVAVETDREAETVVERRLEPDTRVTLHSDTEEITDSAQGGGGNVTVASNLPAGDAGGGNDRQSARTETRERVNYDYSEVRRETVRAAGAIRRISVAVLVDGVVETATDGTTQWQPRPQDELDALRDLVIAAIGYDETRGDIVTVESMAFQPDATPGALVEVSSIMRFLERNAMTLIQLGFLTVVIIVLAMTVLKPLLSSGASAATAGGLDLAPGLTIDANGDGEGPGGADQLMPLPGLGGSPDGLPSLDDFDLSSGGGGGDRAIDRLEAGETPIDALRDIASERPEQTAAMLKQWLEPDATEEEEAA
ncbi:MAG: flagellar basal-body MS-ring/collar protein FliF [Pseudomonadota bacterium]